MQRADYGISSGKRRAAWNLMFSGVSIGAFTSGLVAPVHHRKIRLEGMFTWRRDSLLLSVVLEPPSRID